MTHKLLVSRELSVSIRNTFKRLLTILNIPIAILIVVPYTLIVGNLNSFFFHSRISSRILSALIVLPCFIMSSQTYSMPPSMEESACLALSDTKFEGEKCLCINGTVWSDNTLDCVSPVQSQLSCSGYESVDDYCKGFAGVDYHLCTFEWEKNCAKPSTTVSMCEQGPAYCESHRTVPEAYEQCIVKWRADCQPSSTPEPTQPVVDVSCPRLENNQLHYNGRNLSAEADECKIEAESAEETCHTNADSALGEHGREIRQLSNLANSMTQNMQVACTTFGKLMATMNAGLAAYETKCIAVAAFCESNCKSVREELKEAKKALETCNVTSGKSSEISSAASESTSEIVQLERAVKKSARLCDRQETRIQSVVQDIANYASIKGLADQCKEAVEVQVAQGFCDQFPTAAPCVKKESYCEVSPESLECLCEQRPTDPSCRKTQMSLASGSGVRSFSSMDDGFADGGSDDFSSFASQDSAQAPIERVLADHGMGGTVKSGGGGGGGGMPLGGRGSGAGGTMGSGAGAGGSGAAGYRAGGASGFQNFGGGTARRRGGSTREAPSGTAAARQKAAEQFDLNKYLPMAQKRIGQDGLTPAGGMTIWEKASRRYKVQQELGRTLAP